jgi:hypothetical protein
MFNPLTPWNAWFALSAQARRNLHFLGYFDDPTRAVQSVVLHRAPNIAKLNVSNDAKPSKLRPVR